MKKKKKEENFFESEDTESDIMPEEQEMYEENTEDEVEQNYDEEERRIVILKRLGIAMLIIIGIIILVLLLKSCTNNRTKKYENDTTLLEGAKEYYEYNSHLLPTDKGACSEVTLKTLVEKGILDVSNFKTCDTEKTYVKVCVLESGTLQWVPFMSCEKENTEEAFGMWVEGKETDLVKDESDVSFKFLGQYLNLSTSKLGAEETLWKDEIKYSNYKTNSIINYYRYRDLEYIWNIKVKYYYTSAGDKTNANDVNEYYPTSPASGYTSKDNANSNVYKWYTTVGGTKEYWMQNGAKGVASEEQFEYISQYPYKELVSTVVAYRAKNVWVEVGTPATTTPTRMYKCSKSENDLNDLIFSLEPCLEQLDDNPLYKYQVGTFYTCDGRTEVSQNATCYVCSTGTLKSDNSSCGSYTWGDWSTTKCTGTSSTCETKTMKFYYWYKMDGETRKYYPSNSNVATGEKVYYSSAPVSGAVKDVNTKTTGYKWYKVVSGQTSTYYATSPQEGATKTSKSRWTSWSEWSTVQPIELSGGRRDIEKKIKIKLQQILGTESNEWINLTTDYVTESEMLKVFQDKGYKINSLADINSSGDVRYQIKMFYRNKVNK